MTAKYFAAINIKKPHEAREYKYNYLHLALQKARLRGIHLTVKGWTAAPGVRDGIRRGCGPKPS